MAPGGEIQPHQQPEPWRFNRPVLLRKSRRASSTLIWTLSGGTAAAVLWAAFAPLPQTIAVEGKLEPIAQVKQIEAPVPGVVAAVLVKDGQRVQAGAPLLRFDQRDAEARLKAAQAIRTRLVNENAIAASVLGDRGAQGLTANQERQLSSQRQALLGRNQAARQELARSQARLAGLRDSLSTAENIASRFRQLAASGATSQLQLLEAESKVKDLRSQLNSESREVERLRGQAAATIGGNEADLRSKVEANLRQIADLDKQISEAKTLLSNIQLKAPSSGVVFDLSVGPGSVVAGKAAKPLLKIVPQGQLQARVYVPNDAIGFVQVGQRADLSLTAFTASDYGRVPARVQRIGSDALTAEEQARVLGESSQGLWFPTILRLEQQQLRLNNSQIPLQAGMTLTADIHLRNRPFLSVITGFFEDKRRGLERMR